MKGTAARALAFCLGVFSLLNLVGEALTPGFDATLFWLDLRGMPGPAGRILLSLSALGLLAFSLGRAEGRLRPVVLALTAALAAAALLNTVQFYVLLAEGRIRTRMAVPLSLFVLAALSLVLAALLGRWPAGRGLRALAGAAATAALCAFGFPFLQMLCFGSTDYRRQAQVAVVLGARAYPDGTLSLALEDRMRTACGLFREGLVPRLLVSGGQDGRVNEAEAMRDFAVRQGMLREDVLLDPEGISTEATIRDTVPMLRRMGARRVLVVSHAYHLPRIKLAYAREGVEVWTVPARESRAMPMKPYYVLREVAALWAYYLRPLLGPPKA